MNSHQGGSLGIVKRHKRDGEDSDDHIYGEECSEDGVNNRILQNYDYYKSELSQSS